MLISVSVVKVLLHHVIRADAATYWEWFFDDVAIQDFFLRGLGYKQFDIVEHTEDDHVIRRSAQCHPHVALPRLVASVFNGEFRYLEDGSFDKNTGLWSFAWIPSSFPERILLEGWTRASDRPHDPGSCDRVTEMVVKARFAAVGGLLERHTARVLRDQWNESARVSNEWLAVRER